MSKLRKVTSSNYQNEADLIAGCPLAAAMKLVGGRWKPLILWYVHHGIRRFGGLKSTIVSISEKMLYQQLRELERDGLVVRNISGPRRVEYVMTPLGRSLVPILRALAEWSDSNRIADRLLGATLRDRGEMPGRRSRVATMCRG